MADTIRVTVSAGDETFGSFFDLPTLSGRQIRYLQYAVQPHPVEGRWPLEFTEKDFDYLLAAGLIAQRKIGPVEITPLGRAVLAHYEERGG